MDLSTILDALEPAIVALVAAAVGYGLGLIRPLIVKSKTKLDDAIWNTLTGEFNEAGIITDDELAKLKSLPPKS